MIKDYLPTVLAGIVFAYVFYPVYLWLNKKFKRPNLSATIVSILIILLISIPLGFSLWELTNEMNVGYVVVKQQLARGSVLSSLKGKGIIGEFASQAQDFLTQPEIKFYVQNSLQKLAESVGEQVVNFLFSLPRRFFEIFVTFFILFYLLQDGHDIFAKVKEVTPLDKKIKDRIFRQMQEVTQATVYGVFVIAIIEGIIGGLTLQLAGLESPVLWGLVIAFLAVLPLVGASLIWVPALLFKVFAADWFAVGWILLGGMIIAFVDMVLKPKVIGNKATVHPVLVFLGLLGGLNLLGFIGVIVGPLILALFVTFIEIYSDGR